MSDSLWPHGPCQAPLSTGFSRHEYWTGLPCPLPGDLPEPGIKPISPALAGGFFATSATWEACLPSLPAFLTPHYSRSWANVPLQRDFPNLKHLPDTLHPPPSASPCCFVYITYHYQKFYYVVPPKCELHESRDCLIHLILLVPDIVPGTK